jgi:Ca-activated chloride channel family protein
MLRKALLAFVLPLAANPPAAPYQEQEPAVSIQARPKKTAPASEGVPREPALRIDSNLVLIPVTVVDPIGRFVTGLEKTDFQLSEDGVEMAISHFGAEDAPISLGLVFDMSGSMGGMLGVSRAAVAELLKYSNPEDEFSLVRFSARPELVTGFTRDPAAILNGVMFTGAKNSTALLDAIYLAVSHAKKAARNPRKAIIIISDGGENNSRYTERELRNLAREADCQIYAMGNFGATRGYFGPEEINGPDLLNKICEQTGGRSLGIGLAGSMSDIADKIAVELRNQYVLGYTPKNAAKDGKYRRVRVKVTPPRGLPHIKAEFRRGYYGPTR